jgi:hypothetical protein
MANPLLSTYSGGENRVTASTLAVFERVGLSIVQELLEAATGIGPELTTVTYTNQDVGDGSVPDAVIAARFRWIFETKTVPGAYSADGHGRHQLRGHANQLVDDPEARLFVLTPDAERPAWFDELDRVDPSVKDRVLWLSFRLLDQAIREVIESRGRVVPEQARVLLFELTALYESAGLLTQDDTVIVAANVAWDEFRRFGAYVCQPNRSFRAGLSHLGFYHAGQIEPLIPRIMDQRESVMLTHDEAERLRSAGDAALGDLVDRLLRERARPEGVPHGIFLLTPHDHPDTVRLPHAIRNDTVASSGRSWAWTLGQRYTSLDRLRQGFERTSQLDASAQSRTV